MSFEMHWSAVFIMLDSKDRFALENFSTSRNAVTGNKIVHIHSMNGCKLLLKCMFPKWPVDRAARFTKGERVMGRWVRTVQLQGDRISGNTMDARRAVEQGWRGTGRQWRVVNIWNVVW